MDLIERFRYLMKLNQLTASAFADEIGVQRSSVSHILSGRNKPSLEFIQKVMKRYPKVDAAWLISGVTNVNDEIDISMEPLVEKEQVQPQAPASAEMPTKQVETEKTSENSQANSKSIKRIVAFYTDGTFEEFTA